ncbi:MAG: metal-dependent hydrolase [Armatimonadota bacterium]|nr:metal-dependent hydrolase [Armatimonadota bacterium]
MAQNGIHGLVGLAASRLAGDRGAFRFGVVLGNIAPDLDLIPLALLYLFNRDLALSMHRTFTHSLVTAAAVALAAAWLGRRGGRGLRARWIGVGLAAGIVMHGSLDALVWFTPVDLGWPLHLLGLPARVDLWAGYRPPGRVNSYLGAADYLAYAVYLSTLGIMARRHATDQAFVPALRRWVIVFSALFVVYMALARLLSPQAFTVVHYGPFSLAWVPLIVWVSVRMRATIEAA